MEHCTTRLYPALWSIMIATHLIINFVRCCCRMVTSVGVKARHGGASLGRFEEALNIYAGRCKPFVQEPLLLHYPQLPAIPFYDRDLFQTDLSPASVITIYLLPEVNLMARSKLLALAPGTRIVSHDYGIGDWQPDLEFEMDAPGKSVGRSQRSKVLFWVVPDKVAGRWVWPVTIGGKQQQIEMALKQNYQKLTATAKLDGKPLTVDATKLTGREIELTLTLPELGKTVFTGLRINQAFEGSMHVAGKAAPWNAVRVELQDPDHVTAPPPVIREF